MIGLTLGSGEECPEKISPESSEPDTEVMDIERLILKEMKTEIESYALCKQNESYMFCLRFLLSTLAKFKRFSSMPFFVASTFKVF